MYGAEYEHIIYRVYAATVYNIRIFILWLYEL